jgi:putative transposase
MLLDTELEKLFIEFGLPEKAREIVRNARTNSPVRQVKSSGNNSVISFFSRKMGNRHLQLESRTVEAPAATLYENDFACYEFWPQPLCADLVSKDENGKIISRFAHIPDFLLISKKGIYIHEWREESRLMRLADEGSQFYKDKEDHWHYRAAEDYFTPLGIHYEIHSSLELPRTFIQNIRFLESYLISDCPKLPEETASRLQNLVSQQGSVAFIELINIHAFTADDIFKAVAEKLIAADLHNYRLEVPASLMLHRDAAIARTYHAINVDRTPALPIPGMARVSAGARLVFDGKEFEVVLAGSEKVLLRDADGHTISLPLNDIISLFDKNDIDFNGINNTYKPPKKNIADLSYEQIETSELRLAVIKKSDYSQASTRTIQYWKSKINDSMTTLEKTFALAGRNIDRGNRIQRLPKLVESLAEEAIRKFFNNPDNKTALGAYRLYQDLCEEQNIMPMSYPTFTKRVNNLSSTKAREGKRKAYQETEIPLHLDYVFPVHGVRPHEVCYIDHTIENLATVGPDGADLGKPTFTLATDGNTTQTRAFYLCYDPPSAKVVLMTLRDYVRRHNRLPRILIVDGGKEFRSEELAWFCRIYGIDLRHRPPAQPRGGAPIESALGATEIELIAQLEGNTRIMKNARMVTKSVNPFPRGTWTLTALHAALDEYLLNIRDTRIHPTLGLTPRDYEAMRISETGQREHLLIKFDENIMLLTCPHAKHRFHKIDRIRGVWCDNMYYWHDDFKKAKKGEKVEVRVEPWFANIVYVYYGNRWIAAIARDLRPLAGRTLREVEMARRFERRLAKVNANKDRRDPATSKKMVRLWAPEEFDQRIGLQQREMEHLYRKLGMTVAMPNTISTTAWSGTTKETDSAVARTSPTPEITTSSDYKTDITPLVDSSINSEVTISDDCFWEDINGYH